LHDAEVTLVLARERLDEGGLSSTGLAVEEVGALVGDAVLDVEGVGGDGEKLVEVLDDLVLCRRWEHNAVDAPSGLAGDELPVSMMCCAKAKEMRGGTWLAG
jgi:hypothetical protein